MIKHSIMRIKLGKTELEKSYGERDVCDVGPGLVVVYQSR